ncbi:MAG: TerC/Alx family metal homeostasis membrane protein [Micrococcales bacterium]|nr:TerC/Alx family metal homeostasis membrane protein [Micrococcales bacterium]
MHLDTTTWVVTIALAVGVLAFDLVHIMRHPHVPSPKENLRALGVYITLALAFGVWVGVVHGGEFAVQFYGGWLTEYSLSVDNLFVFLLIMNRFAVPRQYQQSALLVGIILALVLRAVFIVAGAVAIAKLSWVFYLFGAFLLWTAWTVATEDTSQDAQYNPPRIVAAVQRVLPSTTQYHGVRLAARVDGRRVATPMLMVLIAIGITDLLFAFDSIPAVFGLTKEPYLVLMANVFALMGLRQLFFLLGNLLDRLVYLNTGLGVLLAFIGVKLVLHALAENTLPFINGGQHVTWAPAVPAWMGLVAIVTILGVTVLASLWHDRRSHGS